MISRLTAAAACFAILSAATITFAANARHEALVSTAAAAALPVVQLQTVEMIGHRTPRH
jgi:hypothetical protein